MLVARDADLALLPVTAGQAPASRVLYGRLARENGVPVPVVAAGFPWFKLRESAAQPDSIIREVEYATGHVQAGSDQKNNTYAFAVLRSDLKSRGPGQSPWEGMSGAAVWAADKLIGVVAQHHPNEGLAALTVHPIDALFGQPQKAEDLKAWRRALGSLPETREELWTASPPTERQLTVESARRVARTLAPAVLIARESEMADLARTVTSPAEDDRWRWFRATAFAGKTGMLAYFALHPPEQTDMAACFLRRTTGDNTPEYALSVLTRQFAAIAARHYESAGMGFADEFQDLLAQAARASRERGRRLVVLVDGLDEYKSAYAGRGLESWLPDADTLPEGAHLIVASRAGTDVRLSDAHPLWRHQRVLIPSDAAAQLESQARQEIEQVALDNPEALSILALFAAAETGLSLTEVAALARMQPSARSADEGTIAHLLDSALSRTLTHQESAEHSADPVFAFAHDALLDAAGKHKRVASMLPACRGLLDDWAGKYAQRGWPEDTPRYLLLRYADLLIRRLTGRTSEPNISQLVIEQLYQTVSHPGRWPRIAASSRNPAQADREIASAQQALLDTAQSAGTAAEELLYRLAVLSFRRRRLAGRRAEIAVAAAEVWARCGRADDALTLADRILDPSARDGLLKDIAEWHCDEGQLGEALEVAQLMHGDRGSVLSKVARAFAAAGQPDHGRTIAEQLSSGSHRFYAFVEIAESYAAAGRAGDATAMAELARSEALLADTDFVRTSRLTQVARSVAVAWPTWAMEVAKQVGDPSDCADALVEVARAQAGAAGLTAGLPSC